MIATKKADTTTEFSIYLGLIHLIMGIYVSRPKNKSTQLSQSVSSDRDISDTLMYALLTFIITSIVYIEIFIYLICILSLKLYENNGGFEIYLGMLSNLIGIYTSRPKY